MADIDYARAASTVRLLISRVKPEPYHTEKGDCEYAAKLCEAWPLVEDLLGTCEFDDWVPQNAREAARRLRAAVPK